MEFYGTVNTVKLMSRRSVNLLNIFSWTVLVLQAVNQYFTHIISNFATVLLESTEGEERL